MRKQRLIATSRFLVLLVAMAVLLVPLTSPMRQSAGSTANVAAATTLPASPGSSAERDESSEETYCAYWYADQSTKAILEITNNAATGRVITPILLLRGSERVSLEPVTVPSHGTRRISLNKALKSRLNSQNTVTGDSRWADGSRIGSIWGSAKLKADSLKSISSKILSENPRESLAIHSGFYPYGSRSVSSQWWLPTKDSVALFALQNTSYSESAVITLLHLDGRVVVGPRLILPAGGSRLLDLRQLIPKSISKKLPEVGAVQFVAAAESGSLSGRAVLFDEQVGFSAPLAMRDRLKHSTNTMQLTGAPFGRAGKKLGFSKSTEFTTNLLLTNTSNKSIGVTVTLDGKNAGGESISSDLPVVEIPALQSREVDLNKLRIEGQSPIADGYAGVRLTHTGAPVDLLAEAVTVDQTLRVSFDNALYDNERLASVYNAISFNLIGNKKTLLLIKNTSDTAATFGYTLNYETQGVIHSYRSTLSELKPFELRVVDLKSVRELRMPDKDGNVLPAEIEFGNASIYSNRPIIAGDPNFDAIAGITSSCITVCSPEPCIPGGPAGCECDPCSLDPLLCQPPPQPTCTDTCTPCQIARDSATSACLIGLINCESTAATSYNTAINNCENQSYCREDQPTFNAEECNRCRDNALNTYNIQQAACIGVFTVCMSFRRDCSDPSLKKADCSACSN